MTLSYWWMHWFWITSRVICFAVSEETTLTTHSVVIEPRGNTSELAQRAIKATGAPNFNPPININVTPSNNVSLVNHTSSPSSSSSSSAPLATKYPKPSPNKPHLNVTKDNCTKPQFPHKATVINNNNTTTDVSLLSVTDGQVTVNASLVENFTLNESNSTQSVTSSERIIENVDETAGNNLSAAGITGITLGCVLIVGVICVVSFILYRNRGFNRPQVLNDRCSNPDSSGYIDDASVRDNSEEMYSLDNDSFLNSLEAMTIQNYWTDTVKHTKL